jgi:hypothetical protein
MAISRSQLLKELLPGLNALFGLEYDKYEDEHAEIYETENSERSFEEEVKLSGFGAAPVKNEGASITFDTAQEAFTSHCLQGIQKLWLALWRIRSKQSLPRC